MVSIKNVHVRNTFLTALLFVFLAITLMAFLTGCGFSSAVKADPNASAASVDPQAPPETNNLVKKFGEVVTYDDGMSISVSEPSEFTPSNLDYMPASEGDTSVVFKVVLTNNSSEILDPTLFPDASSGGKPAIMIADVGNSDYPNLGMAPTTSVLPGQTIEFYSAFNIADPSNITFEVTPDSFKYDYAIFTNVPF